MPYARPTLTDLRAQVRQDILTGLGIGGTLLRRAVLYVAGTVQAGLAHLHYGYIDWISRQAVPFTATDEFLEGWAALPGITRKAATPSIGSATFSGVTSTPLPAGTPVMRGDGVAYSVTSAGTVSGGGTVTVPIAASVPGSAGNCDSGTVLTLGTAIAGIQASGAAAGDIAEGADVELDDALRTRMLDRYKAPPQGGSQSDYINWALAVPGVTRAWCRPNGAGAGTVVVYTMWDVAESAHAGFPQGTDGVATDEPRDAPATGDQLAVANSIYPLRGATALVYSVSPIPAPQNFTIAGAPVDSRAGISAAIAGTLQLEGAPDGLTAVSLSDIEAAVRAVSGAGKAVVTAPTADIATGAGFLATLGTITWI